MYVVRTESGRSITPETVNMTDR